jgi:DNA-binding MarR family transcriptional regulator/GNAT superfamily N-acetyltransferase
VPEATLDARIAAVRRFNRFYTRQIGVLRKTYLDGPFSLAEARVLYEIGRGEGLTASDIARNLDLDAGYLSRTLRSFEKRGLIARTTSRSDARQSHLALTARGRRTFDPLERRSQQMVAAMLGELPQAEQIRLVSAMRSIEGLLERKSVAPQPAFILREPRAGDFGWIVARHGIVYAQERGWSESFEGLCAHIVADFVNKRDPVRERCWIAEHDGENAGSVLLMKDSENVARLRLLFVEPTARGLGIGRRLVEECIGFAREQGYEKVVLWTQSILTSARKIYRGCGFELTREEPHHSFGADLVGETWEIKL